ncbi:hypothetical protein CYMTET_17941 [Cymbomonas tetramitiformis]|uniref:Uncharacterized protein n=1 Tax=Cymbomonas tetramitiformis TaxID=36881 RepID=A0AAE0G9J0_9CHLO|nr:hypothetical protein CYMTET_17941 [Cymbomonas tetramitiformis]
MLEFTPFVSVRAIKMANRFLITWFHHFAMALVTQKVSNWSLLILIFVLPLVTPADDTHTHSDTCTAAAECLTLGYDDPGNCQDGICTGTKTSSGGAPTPAPSPVPTDVDTEVDPCTAAADCLTLGYADPGNCQDEPLVYEVQDNWSVPPTIFGVGRSL